MNVLLTGGLGYIGSHLAIELLEKNNNVFILDSLINSNIRTFDTLRKFSRNIFFVKGAIHENEKIENLIKHNKIDSIIHLASLKAVGESVRIPAKYYYNNVIGTRILLSIVKKLKIKNFIFSSSATVYGKPLFLPLPEYHFRSYTNPYANNKIDIENMFLGDEYFNNFCSVKILRYFNPVGAHHSGLIGESPKGFPNNLMPYILKVAQGKFKNLSIYGNDYPTRDGTGVRDYIHIMDLIDGHIKSLLHDSKGVSIFNLGTGKGYSVLEMVKTFEHSTNIEIPYIFTKRREGDVAEVYADPTKASNILGFNAKLSLHDMCFDSWNFAKKFNESFY